MGMQEMEKLVRKIEKDGLIRDGGLFLFVKLLSNVVIYNWCPHNCLLPKLIPLAYGIKILQIICVMEDEKVSVDDLIEQITEEAKLEFI
ncbi:unnamed protein product [Brugia pahangi]|uniref:EF1_GNE domain-containing protein n=1 Tax=Brugia pahangi TaxID=6280 RepID=A0A0N4T2N4_BRUPA|nr:unnamed protein product [Brugia pahangi]